MRLTMKKRILCFILIIICALSGCSRKNTEAYIDNVLTKNIRFKFSNIVDNSIQFQLKNILSNYGVSQNSISTFINYIKLFYTAKYPNIIENGYSNTDIESFNKDLYPIEDSLEHWRHLGYNENYLDINCRVAAFTLIKDLISIKNKKTIEILDDKLLSTNSLLNWNKKTKNDYSTLYGNIPINEKSNSQNTINQIKAYLDKNIEFDNNNDMSSVVIYVKESNNDFAQVAHASITIQTKQGIYMIEKYNPQEPYQMSLFEKGEDIISYLISRFNEAKLNSVENIFVFNNNECVFALNK